MAEVFTRKFIQQNGDPVVGGVFRLVNLTNPLDPPCELYEIVSADPEEQGQYYSSLGNTGTQTALDHGVYRIEKWNGAAWVAFGGPGSAEATIEPGRTGRIDGTGTVLIDKILADEVRVSMFVDDNTRSNSHINEALTWAAANGVSRVYVGAYDGAASWSGASQINVPDGLTLDLGGATVEISANAPLLLFAGSGCVKDGFLSGPENFRIATTVTEKVLFQNVDFVRSGNAVPTAAASNNAQTPVVFIGCSNVVLAPATAGTDEQRQNVWIGCTSVKEVGGATADHSSSANVTATELAKLLKHTTTALGTAPSVTPPFADNSKFAEAVKHAWFNKIPALEAAVTAVNGTYEQWSWQGRKGPSYPNGDPDKVTISFARAVISGSPVAVNCERKANVYGKGIHQRLRVSIAGTISFTLTNTSGGPTFDCKIGVEMGDLMSALQAQYPGTFDLLQDSNLSHNVDFYMTGFIRSVLGSTLKAKTEQVNAWSFPYCSTVDTGDRMAITFRDDQTLWGGIVPRNLIYQFGIEMDIPFIQNVAFDERDSSGGFGSIINLQYDPVT